MFDHIGIAASDLEASKAFYLAALEPLGVSIVLLDGAAVGLGQGRKPSFWIGVEGAQVAPMHLAFRAENRAQVEAFHRKALAAGARDNGTPGLHPEYHANYYAAFVIGPDGHHLEVVCHKPE